MTDQRRVVVLGSTGSIGTQAIAVAQAAPDRFRVTAICSGGGDLASLADAGRCAAGRGGGRSREDAGPELQARLAATVADRLAAPEVLVGPLDRGSARGIRRRRRPQRDRGAEGLRATLASLDAGRIVALANKESLVAGGPLVTGRAKPGQLVPVDSEHSALAQCLRSGSADEVCRLVLTASGGPFRGRRRAELATVTPEQALAHPTWDMGKLITTNSATLVNKGLEVIEAHLLFGVPLRPNRRRRPPPVGGPLDGGVRRRRDDRPGVTAGHAAADRAGAGLARPRPRCRAVGRLDAGRAAGRSNRSIPRRSRPSIWPGPPAAAGGMAPAVYNAANEELVAAFHAGHVPFLGIVDTVRDVLMDWLSNHHADAGNPGTVEDVEYVQGWARARARAAIAQQS